MAKRMRAAGEKPFKAPKRVKVTVTPSISEPEVYSFDTDFPIVVFVLDDGTEMEVTNHNNRIEVRSKDGAVFIEPHMANSFSVKIKPRN